MWRGFIASRLRSRSIHYQHVTVRELCLNRQAATSIDADDGQLTIKVTPSVHCSYSDQLNFARDQATIFLASGVNKEKRPGEPILRLHVTVTGFPA